MARVVAIGAWGSLTIYDPDEEPPDSLRGAGDCWSSDDRRRPCQLRAGVSMVMDYVAVWPLDGPPPANGPLTEQDLDGAALASPVVHRCHVCRASVAGLHVDGGAAFFEPWSRKHGWLRACPACGADVYEAKLTGMLPMPGRLPDRWALAGMLGADETDLWPALRAARTRPAEVRAIYPRLDAVPRQVWLDMFMSAEQGIDILAEGEPCFARDPAVMATLAGWAGAGAKARICLAVPVPPKRSDEGRHWKAGGPATRWGLLLEDGKAQVRKHRAAIYHSIYRADDQLLISQQAQGVVPQSAAVLHLAHSQGAVMTGMYLAEFERIWAQASPAQPAGDGTWVPVAGS